MTLSRKYINTASIGAVLLALTFSGTAFAEHDSCSKLFVPNNVLERARASGVPEQYGVDILHSSFTSDLKALARKKKKSRNTVRILHVDAGNGDFLSELWAYYSKRNVKFYGLGVNNHDRMPMLSYTQVSTLNRKSIKIVQGDVSGMHNSIMDTLKPGHRMTLQPPRERNSYDVVIDCLGTFSRTHNVAHVIDYALDVLKPGGAYYITIPWKINLGHSTPVANDWPDISSPSNIAKLLNGNQGFIKYREQYLAGLLQNLGRHSETAPSIDLQDYHPEEYGIDYNWPAFGYSLAIGPSIREPQVLKHIHYLSGLAFWLTEIEGVDVHIETSNPYDAKFINEDFFEDLASKSVVSECYKEWENRYGIQTLAKIAANKVNKNKKSNKSSNINKINRCTTDNTNNTRNAGNTGNLGDTGDIFLNYTYDFEYTDEIFKKYRINLRTAIAGGLSVATDDSDQRYYELFPNKIDKVVSEAIQAYSKDVPRRRLAAEMYIDGYFMPSLAGSEFARKMYGYQKKYGSMLFIKLVKKVDGDIHVPALRPTWTSIGEPVLRNFDLPDSGEDSDSTSDDNANDDSDGDISMQPLAPTSDSSNDSEEKFDEDYDIVD